MSIGLQGVELNYPTIEKQAFAVFKVVKHFHPHLEVRSLLIQKERGDR